jgi:hypothetical protein
MRALDEIYGDGRRIPDFFVGRNIVPLPTVKCHIYTTTTGAMKNAFGGLLNTKRHYTHSWIHETLVDLLAIQKEIHSGLFAIMDGPRRATARARIMKPVKRTSFWPGPGRDRRGRGRLMGFNAMSIPYIRIATRNGSESAIADIELSRRGRRAERWGFKSDIASSIRRRVAGRADEVSSQSLTRKRRSFPSETSIPLLPRRPSIELKESGSTGLARRSNGAVVCPLPNEGALRPRDAARRIRISMRLISKSKYLSGCMSQTDLTYFNRKADNPPTDPARRRYSTRP